MTFCINNYNLYGCSNNFTKIIYEGFEIKKIIFKRFKTYQYLPPSKKYSIVCMSYIIKLIRIISSKYIFYMSSINFPRKHKISRVTIISLFYTSILYFFKAYLRIWCRNRTDNKITVVISLQELLESKLCVLKIFS